MIRTNVVLVVIITLSASFGVAGTGASQPRQIAPATIVMDSSASLGEMQRPVVEFDHAAHTGALQAEGCTACHTVDENGLTPRLVGTVGDFNRNELINAYHDACMSCHNRRSADSLSSGPVTCGECHERRPAGVPARADMRFDYSLHARHSQAFPEKCETCHHIYDEQQQRLRYQKNAEEACRACHGVTDMDQTPSLANASHRDCVGCHLQRTSAGQQSGPVLCVGCHDQGHQAAIGRLEEIPRLLRGQPDTLWIHTAGTSGQLVPFNHLAHEGVTSACSDCHHNRLKPCGSCHSLTGAVDGGGVILERAHHIQGANRSCVGCHTQTAHARECSGCHRAINGTPSNSACMTCHSGPAAPEDTGVAEAEELPPPPGVATVEMSLLPASSPDFPETVVIEGMADVYDAARLPHRRIVEHLDRAVRESRVAARFHGGVERLCEGCHHHTPAGLRPPPCRSCHGDEADPTIDKPGLYVAYHRQCLGCHQEMQLKQQGCEDCHARRGEQS